MSDPFELHAATVMECEARWSCGKRGELFRCEFCGHRFKVGDWFRVVFTNDMPNAGGNPLVCEKCNATTAELRGRWLTKCAEFKKLCDAPENWKMFRLFTPRP